MCAARLLFLSNSVFHTIETSVNTMVIHPCVYITTEKNYYQQYQQREDKKTQKRQLYCNMYNIKTTTTATASKFEYSENRESNSAGGSDFVLILSSWTAVLARITLHTSTHTHTLPSFRHPIKNSFTIDLSLCIYFICHDDRSSPLMAFNVDFRQFINILSRYNSCVLTRLSLALAPSSYS